MPRPYYGQRPGSRRHYYTGRHYARKSPKRAAPGQISRHGHDTSWRAYTTTFYRPLREGKPAEAHTTAPLNATRHYLTMQLHYWPTHENVTLSHSTIPDI